MIKVKDGYAKLIGTTYQGSATQVLLSNGGDLEYSASSKASTLVQRNASQYIYATYFNSAISDEALTDIGSVYVRNTSDTFIRRVSKTQFYSILDNKFVTLDTTQSITGAKTFSTSVRFVSNASIIQNQDDTSNYTTILKWYKNGASRNTYDPSIGQHNTGGDGNGSICILPYPTATSPWDGTVGLFISKGVLKLDGKSVALAENYYTKTESDERYVNVTGDTMTGPLIVKAAITGTQLISTIATGTSPLKVTSTTVVTNLNSDLLDGLHETSFFRARGDQSIASSVPTTTELANNNNLCGSWNVTYTGASGHLVQFNTGSGSTRYMQFYSTYSGSLYWRNSTDSTLNTKSWKTIVDSANYTGIVLKIGTATTGSATLPIYLNAGTPTACSTTLGVSITGNAATATKLQTARTINGTSFDGTTNIVTAYWGTARTISLSGAVTGSASVNGSQDVTITTTAKVASTLTFVAGAFTAKTYNGSAAVTVNIPTHTSHLTNNSGFWTGTRYWANIAVSTASSTSTQPTFDTCYTSNWFRSTGNTGWYSQTYGGGWYMTDSTWIKIYGSKSVYQNTGQIRTDGYLVTNGGITVGATSPDNNTYKSHVTGNSWSSGYIRAGAGFYHNSVNSNSYVLLAGGSYKSLADFVKGNAGASNRGVYVTNGTVTAMTYYLNATVNSGASGKLAYYSGTNSIDDYTNTIGSSSTPIYINNGIPNAANSYRVVNSGHYFSAFGISGFIYVIRYGQVVCVSINMSVGGNGSTGTTTLLTNLPSAVYVTGQSASKGGGAALRWATFYISGTTLYVYSYQADMLPNKVSFTYITNA